MSRCFSFSFLCCCLDGKELAGITGQPVGSLVISDIALWFRCFRKVVFPQQDGPVTMHILYIY